MGALAAITAAAVAPDRLARPRARAVAAHVSSGRHPFVRLVECRQATDGGPEAVVVEVEVERAQEAVHDILPVEPVALVFAGGDGDAPAVFALRPDFPPVPHLILGEPGAPRMLCLYDAAWSEARLTWTPPAFIERVRDWLARTARGGLHADDQPLEPLLLPTRYTLVLPPGLFDAGQDSAAARLSVALAASADPRVLVARLHEEGRPGRDGVEFVLTAFRCPPQQHGVVRHAPRDLGGLHGLLAGAGLDLLGGLRRRLASWAAEAGAMRARLIIAVAMPKVRERGAEVEAEDVLAFVTEAKAAEVGVAVGCLERVPSSETMARLIPFDHGGTGSGIRFDLVTPVLAFDRRTAARSTGRDAPDDRRVVCVGVGSLGSQVATIMTREGFGRWTPVDPDHLLPHNLARHAAPGHAVGHGKAEVVAAMLADLFGDEPADGGIQADVLDPGGAGEEVRAALLAADLIVDASASVAVARHLARDEASPARRASVFLNPAGTDLALLAEDAARSVPLDALEMQYYEAVASAPELDGHLARPTGRFRYARSCRDVSSAIPQSRVATLAGIAAAALRRAADDPAATLAVWRVRDADLGVDVVRRAASPVLAERHDGWEVSTSRDLLDRLRRRRAERLPNETGGVLIGGFDAQRRIVHVAGAIPSPADSVEWPTLYVRGAEGLPERLRAVEELTLGQLRYVGEWHSHPDGCGCGPSGDDRQVLAWLADHMAAEGLPAVMAIVGEEGHRFLVRSPAGGGDAP